MKFCEYNPFDEKGACVLRTMTKLLNKDYLVIKDELINLSKDMDYSSYNEVEVFEKYLDNNQYKKIDITNILVRDLVLENGKYAIFCYKNDFYHMVSVIDNIIYDKNDNCLDLMVISVYKLTK